MLFESGPRLAAALADLAAGSGAREAAICRELTKLHEEVRRADLDELARDYAGGAETRGEFVIVIAPPAEESEPIDDVDELLRSALHARLGQGRGRRSGAARPAGRAARSINARSRSRKENGDGARTASSTAATEPQTRDARPEQIAAFRARHFGRKPRRGFADRQGLSHPGAALEKPARRDRYRRAAAAHC